MLVFESRNPQFSFVIGKNPDSGLVIDSFRRGHFIGWYPPADVETDGYMVKFCVTFMDDIFGNSFSADQNVSGDYLNYEKYCSRNFLYHVLQNLFSQNLKRESEHDQECIHLLTWSPVLLDPKTVANLEMYMIHMGVNFRSEILDAKAKKGCALYRLTFGFQSSFNLFAGMLLIVGSFLRSRDNMNIQINSVEPVVQKMGAFMEHFRVPYFMRKTILLKLSPRLSDNQYLALAKHFESVVPQHKLEFTEKGNNQDIREAYVRKILKRHVNDYDVILDFGCGSYNTRRIKFAKELSKTYVGIDQDAKVLDVLHQKIDEHHWKHVELYCELDELLSNIVEGFSKITQGDRVIVLCTEVIEHMAPEEYKTELSEILEFDVIAFVFTTPNKKFNPAYLMDEDEVRHEDHVHEYTPDEFKDSLTELFSFIGKYDQLQYTIQFGGLGDTYNDEPSILCAVAEKMPEETSE